MILYVFGLSYSNVKTHLSSVAPHMSQALHLGYKCSSQCKFQLFLMWNTEIISHVSLYEWCQEVLSRSGGRDGKRCSSISLQPPGRINRLCQSIHMPSLSASWSSVLQCRMFTTNADPLWKKRLWLRCSYPSRTWQLSAVILFLT